MSTAKERSRKVEFRWREHEASFADTLHEEAKRQGRSDADHARELLKDALSRDDVARHEHQQMLRDLAGIDRHLEQVLVLPDALKLVQQNIYAMQDMLITAVAKLLADSGKLSQADAVRWVRKSLSAE